MSEQTTFGGASVCKQECDPIVLYDAAGVAYSVRKLVVHVVLTRFPGDWQTSWDLEWQYWHGDVRIWKIRDDGLYLRVEGGEPGNARTTILTEAAPVPANVGE